jgi:hypothetical protein
MARGSDQATTAGTSAQNMSNQFGANAGSLYSSLAPELESEAAHPAGFGPSEMAHMDTAAQQSAGGSNAGAVGQGALLASRTRNAGTADAAVQQSARDSGKTLSKATLGVQNQDAMLKQSQRRAALGGLQGLYGTEAGSSLGALGIVPQAVNANTNASNASWNWAKYLLDPAMGGAADYAASR